MLVLGQPYLALVEEWREAPERGKDYGELGLRVATAAEHPILSLHLRPV